ncbi:hypothetical protein THAOC_36294 [Thalassiosira oceanica]|uniref:Uncharacterized protein n=1 Tax=Thalassiosira oceanica TaxID=159749 RepID=K0R0F2_THAOC|nr:hypothetical protein THAOC_36294 [Thalassiosira oceanica]|mmetsp:Transcript_19139/g.44798  ORF Transcript_19139/g.44798 Transcript_19139/m.44798 type:complete len:110 (-) Transcript_19139:113-442(-)|eukprot:EJK45115.1 hypothetical protein THAOC_36294 [Thalassiosira oceanica]
MRNPVNYLASAAPRALDSLLGPNSATGSKDGNKKKTDKKTRDERACSFDLDLSGLTLSGGGGTSLASASVTDEGSVVSSFTLEGLSSEMTSELAVDLALDTANDDASPN